MARTSIIREVEVCAKRYFFYFEKGVFAQIAEYEKGLIHVRVAKILFWLVFYVLTDKFYIIL